MIKHIAFNEVILSEAYECEIESNIILSDEEAFKMLTTDPSEMNIEVLEAEYSFIDGIYLRIKYRDDDQKKVVQAFNEQAYDDYMHRKILNREV